MPFSPLTLVGLLLVVFLLEIALFWASTALGSADVNLTKLLLGAFLAALVWVGAAYGVSLLVGSSAQALGPENRLNLALFASLGLVVSWAVSAVVFVPLLPVSVPRGMLISVFQLLLRLFRYVLIGAVVMVVLAVLQIRYGPEKRPDSTSAAAARLSSS